MKKIACILLISLALLCGGCDTEDVEEGADGAQDTGSIFVDNGCGC